MWLLLGGRTDVVQPSEQNQHQEDCKTQHKERCHPNQRERCYVDQGDVFHESPLCSSSLFSSQERSPMRCCRPFHCLETTTRILVIQPRDHQHEPTAHRPNSHTDHHAPGHNCYHYLHASLLCRKLGRSPRDPHHHREYEAECNICLAIAHSCHPFECCHSGCLHTTSSVYHGVD